MHDTDQEQIEKRMAGQTNINNTTDRPSGSFRETADQAMNQGLPAGAAIHRGAQQLGAYEQAKNFDYEMSRRRLANVALQLQALAQEGHSKGIYVMVHKHSPTLSSGMVVVEYGPFTLMDLTTWAEKLARFDSFSFKFTFPRLDSY